MYMNPKVPKFFPLALAIAIACIFRLIPHYPNFTPMAAIALMGGAYITSGFWRFAVPLLAMIVSDYITVTTINAQWITPAEYFTSPETLLVYFSVALMTAIGIWYGKNKQSLLSGSQAARLGFASFGSALVFFLVSNFGTWISGHGLEMTFSGLMGTYALGIPFFGYTISGSVVYSFLFFGLLELGMQRWPILARQTVK
ncbi:MAG: DUF6580 family putative transport protein [Bacteroidia bacterium]|jgi:hypothetical protein